jgi:tetratricopeptide (TPR) repeat protein
LVRIISHRFNTAFIFSFSTGASFQIDSCQFNAEEDLWYIKVHATDYGVPSAVEYMEYQKRKMVDSNMLLMFGNLLFEMGEYATAERYFDTILYSSNPNDEEIACIFFNFGRVHRLKGDFNRAISCYHRAYSLHMNARPKRSASAGKTLNGLGVVYSEQGKQLKAEDCFQHAMKLYSKSLPKKHVDIAGTLINLGIIDCNRQDVRYNLKENSFFMLPILFSMIEH